MCSKHGWLPYQLVKISLFFSLPVRDWMPPENGIVGGPSRGHHTMVPVSLTDFLNGLQWPLSAVSFSDCSASYQKCLAKKRCLGQVKMEENVVGRP